MGNSLKVWFVGGTNFSIRQSFTAKVTPEEVESLIEEYGFDTYSEQTAFLRGVEAGQGWEVYNQFDTREEAKAYIQSIVLG